jgi:hypothetical protein
VKIFETRPGKTGYSESIDSPHYFRQKGADAEGVIHDLANKTFFVDWCYPNPKKPDGKELCDCLIVFDDTAIIWQIKDLKVDEQGRYKKAEVEKNLRQLAGARRALFDLREPIVLTNPRRGAEQFNPDAIKHVHLISVLMGEGEEPFPFVQEYKERHIHVFTREFADIALSELNTVADFCKYLRDKEAIGGNKMLIVEGGEQNLLGKYLYNEHSFQWMEKYDLAYIDDTIWPAIIAKPDFIAKKKADEISYGWDSIIDRAHEGSARYELVARELARPNRFVRRILSQTFMEGFMERRLGNHEIIRRMFAIEDTTYCFLFTNDTDDKRKKQRHAMLQSMCFVARGMPPFNSRVVGVATDKGNNLYDFAFLKMPDWTADNERLKKQIQAEVGIFVSPRITTSSEDEYPVLKKRTTRTK